MRFTSLSVLVVVGAVSASPIAVPQQPPAGGIPHLRFGLALGARDVQNHVDHSSRFLMTTTGEYPCAGARSRFKQKSLELSNAFRQALGMPLLEVHPIHGYTYPQPSTGAPLKIFDHPVIRVKPINDNGFLEWNIEGHPHPHPHHPGHRHAHAHYHRHGRPFMMRLHFALTSLGRWEGRAVAFVLGCGIGVIIRMFWVLAVVAYRAVNGNNEQEEADGYLRLSEIADAEEIFVAPPQYAVDEKVAPVDDKN